MALELELFLVALNLFMAVFYYKVGHLVLERRPEGEGNLAATAFALWWFTLAILQLGSLVNFIIRHTIEWSLPSYMAYTMFVIVIIVAALGGLTYYFLYLFTGRRQTWVGIAVAYVVYFGLLVYYIFIQDPVGINETATGTELAYANDLSESTFAAVVGILLLAPPLIGAVGYFSLFFKVPERSQRFRIASVGGAFILWFGSSLTVSRLTDWNDTLAWQVVAPLIALTATLMVYFAFRPAAWMRKRFGLAGYGEAPS